MTQCSSHKHFATPIRHAAVVHTCRKRCRPATVGTPADKIARGFRRLQMDTTLPEHKLPRIDNMYTNLRMLLDVSAAHLFADAEGRITSRPSVYDPFRLFGYFWRLKVPMYRETNRSGRSQNTSTWSYPATRVSLSQAWQNSQSEFCDEKLSAPKSPRRECHAGERCLRRK
jgi:hypothetical protein